MSNNDSQQQGCSEEYAELCALSTSGELSAEEWSDLRRHVAGCEPCAALLREYTSLVSVGMAKLAAEEVGEGARELPYGERREERRLVTALHAAQPDADAQGGSAMHLVTPSKRRERRSRFEIAAGIAAALLLCIAGAFQLGRKSVAAASPSRSIAVAPTSAASPSVEHDGLVIEKLNLRKQLAATQTSLSQVTKQAAEADKQVADLSLARESLLATIDELTKKSQTSSDSLLAVTQQRDSLQQQLNDASRSLQQVKEDLSHAQQDRQGAVLRVASLENEVNDLHAAMTATNRAASTNEQFLSEDRDIRELMGARQLYIADVLDVQSNGERSKPFGRVFYTKGKSLVFYAFDLQAQPGYREAAAFQAWGKQDSSSGKPVSLGIFYLDNEKNKRWVLKSDNPNVLAEINSVFVTVEPQGGSLRPTSKPFLEAYLHTLPPNHP